MPHRVSSRHREPASSLAEGVRVALHEVRRPLALARGYLEMALTGTFGPVDDRLRQPLGILEGKLNEVQMELEQLALIARLGTDELGPELTELDVTEEVGRAAERMRPQANLQGATLELVTPDEPVPASADPVLLARVLDNLVQNGLTYSERPASVVLESGFAGQPFIRVRDRGMGMDRETSRQVFDKGFRGEPDDRHRPGSGLGLYLSEQAAERMGATLEVEWSHPGRGTSFLLCLRPPPFPASDAADARGTRP
jgi:signal transduction histidine kinase